MYGLLIKSRRLELGIDVGTLSKAIGKNRATLYRYENEEMEVPYKTLELMAKALHTNPAYLMGWSNDARQNPKEFKTESPKSEVQEIYDALPEPLQEQYISIGKGLLAASSMEKKA